MNINWILRLKNPATCIPLVLCIISFIYEASAIIGITPGISESDVVNGIVAVLTLVLGGGIVTDPTTKGFQDSDKAMSYDVPNDTTNWDMVDMPSGEVTDEEIPSQEPVADMEEEDE